MLNKATTWQHRVGMSAPTSGKRWQELDPPLSASSLRGVQKLGFKCMTPVQSATIPFFLQNKDVAVEAVTGSGKTLAFVIPVIEILTSKRKQWASNETGALVITPTRELATQIAGVVEHFLPCTLSQLLLIGGRDTQDDVTSLNETGAQIVVATPGRLVDLLERSKCNLASAFKFLEVLVLDEADRLLELGFEQSINTVLSYLPKQRRTGLFSATLTQDVKALMRAGMRNPVTITVRDKKHQADLAPTPSSLCNYYMVCSAEEKYTQLLTLFEQFKDKKTMVFFATCASVSYFANLTKRLVPSLKVLALHGRMHKKRQKCFTEFSNSTSAILMCTDVMARGIDFPHVDWVIQFDPPSSTKAFVHRCGRTARMGSEGQALVMLLHSEVAYVDFLQLNQHISLQLFENDATFGEDVVDRARELAVREREVFEQGKRAFVSFVHFYYKHECKLIFQAKDLDIVGLAKGYALPHLPRMPELKDKDTSPFSPHSVPPSAIPYKDKKREKLRLVKLEQKVSGKTEKKKQHVIAKVRPKHVSKQARRRPKKRCREEMSTEELDELARDARLLKKFKAGKITKQELETQLDDIHV